MKNKLLDLNNHLFAQLERLSDEDLKGDELQNELARAKAITGVSQEIICTGRLALDAQKVLADYLRPGTKLPPMLTMENDNE